tara:strand:+ start:3360 stop:3614 length:255 start_codon:yes stop_codon:yes gene_type:complete
MSTSLATGVPQTISTGIKSISFRMTAGTAEIQKSDIGVDDFVVIASSAKTASSDFNLTLPSCQIQAVLTGDATATIDNVKTGAI